MHQGVHDRLTDGFERVLDLVNPSTTIADDRADREIAPKDRHRGLDHLRNGTSYCLVVEKSRAGGRVRAVHDHRDHQLREELLRKLSVCQEAGERQSRRGRGPRGDAEPEENGGVVGLREFGEPGPHPPKGAAYRLVVQVFRRRFIDEFAIVQGLNPSGHDHRDFRLGHVAVAVTPSQIGASGDAVRGDIDRTSVRRSV